MRSASAVGIKVMLDGQGADELFAGYLGSRGWALRSIGIGSAVAAVLEDHSLAESVATAYAVPIAPPWVATRYRLRRASPYVTRELALAAAARIEARSSPWLSSRSALRRELMTQTFQSSLPHLCRFADRNGMAFGVETRFPYLDYRVAEFALSAPAQLLYRSGTTKRLLRDALVGLVPSEVLDRRDKVAFETPEATWFCTTSARERIAEILFDPGGAIDGLEVRALRADLREGRWRDASALWRMLNAALWTQQWARPITDVGNAEIMPPAVSPI